MDCDVMTFLFTQIFTACGLLMAVISFVIRKRGKAGVARMSRHTTGRVIRNEANIVGTSVGRHRSGRSTVYFPVVEFTGPTGELMELMSNCGSHPPKYYPGEQVDVWYNPKCPKEFRMDDYLSLIKTSSLILRLMAVLFVFVGVLFGYLAVSGLLMMS